VVRGSLLVSALINIGHGWEYQAVDDLAHSYYYIFVSYTKINGYSYSDYPKANQGQPFFIYSIVYFVVNFGLFFILNTGIEVKLVHRMHKELKEKRARLAHFADSPELTTSFPENKDRIDKNKTREELDAKKERRVIKMVVLNSILNFLLRAPDCLFWMKNKNVWGLIFNTNSMNTYTLGLLSPIADVGFFTYILTFSTNFIIFYKFNSKFKESFMTLKKKVVVP
jgi:hypothetical protein